MLFATAIPALLAGVHFHASREDQIAEARRSLVAFARYAISDLEDKIEGTVQFTYGLARARELDTRDRAACSAFLGTALASHSQYTGILTIDPDGRLFCDSLRTGRELDLTDRGYFRKARVPGTRFALEPVFGRLTGIGVLQVAYPARRDDGSLRFVLLPSLNLERFARNTIPNAPFNDTVLAIVKDDGSVLVWSAEGAKIAGTSLSSSPLIDLVRRRSADTREEAGPDGVRRIWTSAALADAYDAPVRILVGVPRSTLIADANRRFTTAMAVLATVALGLFGAAWGLAEFGLRRQIARAVAMTERLASGDLAARIPGPHQRGEIGGLMQALNHTAEALQQRQREVDMLNHRLTSLIDSSPAGIACVDKDGRLTLWNPASERIFGYVAAEVLGSPPSTIDGDRGQEFEAIMARALAGEATEAIQTTRRRKDGQVVEVSVSAAPLRGAGDAIEGVTFAIIDTSEIRSLEMQLRQAQKMEAIGHLTGGMAHDFNNLLTVVMGNAETLSDSLDGQPDLKALAEAVLGAAQRGADLNNRLLAFARRQTLAPKVVDLGTLLSDMEGLLRRMLHEDIDIAIRCAPDLWRVTADPSQLESAVLNLCINARDAMADGGTLTIEAANRRFDARDAEGSLDITPGEYAMVAVSDTGAGIAPGVLARVFDPFFTTKEFGKGSGLGLSMVHGFVNQSRGHVRIYSEVGQGTTVRIYLPRADAVAEADDHVAGMTPVAQSNSETILVVEDDEPVRRHAMAQLESLGYQAIAASDGPTALAVLRGTGDVDLLFTDMVMPGGMTGQQLAEEATRLRPSLKVLYTSGYAEDAIAHQGRLRPGALLLAKPYRRADLARKVRAALTDGT
ncbi:MAG: PAS domain S-box protein [Reyranellaceae bacterium]